MGQSWQFLDYAYVAAMVTVFLGLSIFVHELGHFIAARRCGMIIDAFSLGFGPALWKRKIRGTTYKIGWFPFGGYVALPQLDPEAMAGIQGPPGDKPGLETERRLPPVAPWKKIVVSVSGGVGNVILATLIAWLVYWIGIPATASQRSAMIGFVEQDSEAWKQGLRVGDTVRSVNDKPVKDWGDVIMEVALRDEVTLAAVSQEGAAKTVRLETESGPQGIKTLMSVYGLSLCKVLRVVRGKSAERAGIMDGDLILEFDGIRIINSEQFIALVNGCKDRTVPIEVRRKGKNLVVDVTPEYDEELKRAVIGIQFDPFAVDFSETIHPRPFDQLRDHSKMIFRFLGALVTPKQSANAAKAVGGPVKIIEAYCRLVASSLMLAVWFTGMLNVNLAILNLLPLPVLDGGLVVVTSWEAITRKTVSRRLVNGLWNAFAMLLIALVFLITYRDVKGITPRDSMVGRMFQWVDAKLSGGSGGADPVEAPTGGVSEAVGNIETNR